MNIQVYVNGGCFAVSSRQVRRRRSERLTLGYMCGSPRQPRSAQPWVLIIQRLETITRYQIITYMFRCSLGLGQIYISHQTSAGVRRRTEEWTTRWGLGSIGLLEIDDLPLA